MQFRFLCYRTPDQVALELAQCSENVEDEPAARRGGVDGFS